MHQKIKAKNLYEFIDLTKVRTAMYIGDESLSGLYYNIVGYNWACELHRIDEKLQPDFYLFHDFVANYYLYSESTAGWKNIILAKNFGNEKQALVDFYKLFDLFRTAPKISNAKKVLFKILDKIINNKAPIAISNGNLEQLPIGLKSLADSLEKVKYSFEYDDILEELEALAKTDKLFDSFLNDTKNLL